MERSNGCITNFNHGDQKLTIWKHGDFYSLSEFGAQAKGYLPLTYDALFQSIAKEMHRLACEVGALRRQQIDTQRSSRFVAAERERCAGVVRRLLDQEGASNPASGRALQLLERALDRINMETTTGRNLRLERLMTIRSALDDFLGDTDPSIPDDATDEEVRAEHPVFWACRELSLLIDGQATRQETSENAPSDPAIG